MKPIYKGIIVGILQVGMVASLGAKLLYDRATKPRVWVRAASYDPDLPFRGRYVSLQVPVEPTFAVVRKERTDAEGKAHVNYEPNWAFVRLEVKDKKLVAHREDASSPNQVWIDGTTGEARLSRPILFFIPEHVPDPSRVDQGEELWVEVTIPRKGPPRPIQLAVKKGSEWRPLELR
jgi:hypothetical protein